METQDAVVKQDETGEELTELSSQPRIWDPVNESDHPNPLIGPVLGYDSLETEFGNHATVLVREEKTGTIWSRMIAGRVLEGQFAHRKPTPGETIRLAYAGERTSKSGKFEGKSYHSWLLSVRRPPQVPDWRLLAEGEVRLVDAAQDQQVISAAVEAEVPIAQVDAPADQGDLDDVPF